MDRGWVEWIAALPIRFDVLQLHIYSFSSSSYLQRVFTNRRHKLPHRLVLLNSSSPEQFSLQNTWRS